MHKPSLRVAVRASWWRRVKLMVAISAVSASAAAVALVASTEPASANVVTSDYTIGSPTGTVGGVVVTPASVAAAAYTDFQVSFTAAAALAGSSSNWVTVSFSEAMSSTPVNIDLIGGNCIQAGTSGTGGLGLATVSGLTIYLGGSCSIAAGATVDVDFDANAPATTGSISFTVSTSNNTTPGTSNAVTVGTSGVKLSSSSQSFGANAVYTISNIPVYNETANQTSLTLTAGVSVGSELLVFYPAASGYTVTYAPSGGAPVADPVTAINYVSSFNVILTLADSIPAGDTLNITALGTNPAPTTSPQANDITVQPGNGTPEATNAVTFGYSVASVTVSPSTLLADASATYTVNFRASDTVGVGGYIFLNEASGLTNFASVTGIEVSDLTQGTHLVAVGSSLAQGAASIPLPTGLNAGDFVSLTLVNVINPAAGTISDFAVSTSSDSVPADAAPYTIGASTSTAVVVTVSPSTAGSLASYSISGLVANPALAGGSSTITLQGPAGTVFPNNPGYYTVTDASLASGSGTATAVSGGGTNVVVITVPNNINAGDALSLAILDVINPSAASAADTISLLGNVTGSAPVATTTTTTTAPKPVPVVTALTSKATFPWQTLQLKLSCATAACQGKISLLDVRTVIGTANYSLAVGKTGSFVVRLSTQALGLMANAKGHTITVTETVTLTGGTTIQKRVSLVSYPAVSAVTAKATVSGQTVPLELSCGGVGCHGQITLVDVTTVLSSESYSLGWGKSGTFYVPLSNRAMLILAVTKGHTITAKETVTVSGGKTVTKRVSITR